MTIKFQRLLARGKTAYLAIVGIVFGCIGRAKHDKFVSNSLDKYRQIVAVNGRGVPAPQCGQSSSHMQDQSSDQSLPQR